MRWITFVIAAYLFVCVQFALGALLGWRDATPDVVVVLVAFIALHARPRPALIAAFLAGLMHDVVAGHGLGAYALAYPLAAAFAAKLREVMYVEFVGTHAAVTLLLGLIVATYLELRHAVRIRLFADDPSVGFWRHALAALGSAALAIPVFALLRKMRRLLGLSSR